MLLPYLPDDYLDRFVRESSSNYDYSVSYAFNTNITDFTLEFDLCSLPTGYGWASVIALITIFIGLLASVVFLVVIFRDFNLLDSSFLFLNNFLFASFMNLMTDGILKINFYRSFCWSAGRLACKTSFTVLDSSENAMTIFLIALILEQNHPRVYSFYSNNVQTRKLVTTLVLWVMTFLFSFPEMFLYDLNSLYPGVRACGFKFSYHKHGSLYYHKATLIEYFIPLVLLVVTCIHAAVLLRRSNTFSNDSEAARNGSDNQLADGSANEYPRMRMTSLVIGATFFVTKMPHYLSLSLISSYRFKHSQFLRVLFYISPILYPIPSTIAPILVLFSSPFHKKRLTEIYQCMASCISGRRVQRGFTLGAGDDEEKLEEIKMETEEK